jgi:multicomponent Na+:H+ antiporter subunit E
MRPSLVSRAWDCVVLAAVFQRELVKSSVAVAHAAFAREPRTASAIIAMPIALRTDFGIAVLANMVTLTPGTCSLHISDDRRTLFIHSLDAADPEAIVADIRKVFEDRIRRIEG